MKDRLDGIPTTGLLRLAYNTLSARIFSDVASAGHTDLRPSHGNVFEQLSIEDGLRLTDLAAFAGMTAQSMSELVDDLERKGYIQRRPDPADRRAKRIYLTDKGQANVLLGFTAARKADEFIDRALGRQRHEELRGILEAVIAADPATRKP